MNAPRTPLKSLDDALTELLAHAAPLPGVQAVSTFEADGRVLARDLVSALQVPPQDNSAMDGYAVRVADVPERGIVLPVSQRIAAGAAGVPLAPGTAARIFTGAPVPPGADAVVMQEDCEPLGSEGAVPAGSPQGTPEGSLGSVRINAVPSSGLSIRRSGEDVRRGEAVLRAGERIGPAALGLAASIGLASVPVAPRPRVALFSTGDELVMPGERAPEEMPPGAIYNSNRFFLRALLRRLGCEVTDLGIVPDRRDATVEALRGAARGHDLILTSGGVSVGEEDHIKPAVQALGTLTLWQIAMKPGKPFAYGTIARGGEGDGGGNCHFIGLPGNPVSSYVTFLVLVRPFLLRLQGASVLDVPAQMLPAHFGRPKADKRREFLRARRDAQGGVELFDNQSSGVLTSLTWADGIIDTPPGQSVARGDLVRFLPLSELLA